MFVARAALAGAHAMGMDLASNFALAASTTDGQVTGWTPRSGFPSTVIASSKLVADGTGVWTLNAKVTLTAAWSSATALSFTIRKNAGSAATLSIPFNGTSATLTPQSISLASGDTVWITYTTPFSVSGTLLAGAANTFLYFS